MKKPSNHLLLLICIAIQILCLSACSSSVPDVQINEKSSVLVDAFASLTEGDFENAVAEFTNYKSLDSKPNLAVEIGIGKAYFGVGDFANAEIAFESANGIASDKADIIHYLGEAQMKTGHYPAAVETFSLLLEIEPENKTALSKLEQALRSSKDYNGLYTFFENRISAATGDGTEKEYYESKLIEAVQLTKDDDLIGSVLGRFGDLPLGYALDVGFEAFAFLISGDEESMRELLFDIDTIEALTESAGRYGCYFGDFNDFGEYSGMGIMIFGSDDRNTISQVYFGEFAHGEPNGAGIGYRGTINEWENNGEKRLQKSNRYIEGEWREGIPEGNVTITNEYVTYLEGVLEHASKAIDTGFYVNRLAQGEYWTANYYDNPNDIYGPSVSYRKHFVVDGRPVPFEISFDGRMVMAYEAHYDETKDRVYWVNEEACTWCSFGL